ncbi:hypothetical protein K440DRAFT_613454, partial [Wilcoxina mikolae CBS 423.85]
GERKKNTLCGLIRHCRRRRLNARSIHLPGGVLRLLALPLAASLAVAHFTGSAELTVFKLRYSGERYFSSTLHFQVSLLLDVINERRAENAATQT